MKLLYFLLFPILCFSQAEASFWYFGENAGIKFQNNGSVTPLLDGKLNTLEGCATLSDNNGKLLFYTDGKTIYNRNHQIMLNGTGLKGHESSTQSATIIQKPGSNNLFYVFTADAVAKGNGLMYSEIDINLDGGNGGVTSNKNLPIYTPTCEKISIVKHSNNTDYWIITHGWENNTFYAHLITASGVSTVPVTSNSGAVVGGTDVYRTQGYMKISPNGKKLVLCHQFLSSVELFDFDPLTGIVNNPKIINKGSQPYGAEFSPNSDVLYVSLQIASQIYQYDLNAADIASSEKLIAKTPSFLGALQLGPNSKIYIANYNTPNLGVINNPNILGTGCNLEANAVDLGGRKAMLGLPAFNQSFFIPSFNVQNLCLNSETKFILNLNPVITSADWDFGDGTTSNDLNPTHIYKTAGKYNVKVLATSNLGTGLQSKEVIISEIPTASKPTDLFVCDENNDGKYAFDLTAQNSVILKGQDPDFYSINYIVDNTIITTPNSYINPTAYQKEIVTAEVYNKANPTCKSTTTFEINVSDTPKPNLPANIPDLVSCDNNTVGSDKDGRVIFDLTQNEKNILNGQSSTQFIISYYKDAAFMQAIVLPKSYSNSTAAETIFVKVTNKDNSSCIAATSFNLKVFPLPIVLNSVDLKQCDDDVDGFSAFNLEEATIKISPNSANETFTFYKSLNDAQNNSNPISNPTTYRNQTVNTDKVYVSVENANNCHQIAQLNLFVSTTQIPSTYSKTFIQCDDAELGTNKDGIAAFDLSSVTAEVKAIFPSGQLLDISYYQNLENALQEKNAISDISNYRNISSPYIQKIFIRVDSRLNNDCLGLGGYITLRVEPVPISQNLKKTHCDDDHDGFYTFDTSTIEEELVNGLTNVKITYLDEHKKILPSPLPNPFNTNSQIVKAVLTNNTTTGCSFTSTITFIVDDMPQVFPIDPMLTTVCDDEDDPVKQDGKYAFDTSSFETILLGGQKGMIINYYDSDNNLLASPLPNPFVTNSQKIKVEVINPKNNDCSATAFINFIVNPVPDINLKGEELVCSNLPDFTKQIDAGLLDINLVNDYNYTWFFNGTIIPDQKNYNLTVNKEGIFTVEVSNKKTNCSRTRTIKVSASDIASNIIAEVDKSNMISIFVAGKGDYVYALDDQNGDYLRGNTFENVHSGIHTVFIKDLNGCGIIAKEVAVFGIPTFFTPNQDSFNDYWNIEGVDPVSSLKTTIQIFDRYGKFIKQISPMSEGWDGTYLGAQMPADDYWYAIRLDNGKIFKGHFALKR